MKNLFQQCCVTCFFLITIHPVQSQQFWLTLSTPVQQTLRTEYFTDWQNGWIAGDSGVIIHTGDGGLNWEIQESGISNQILDIFFINELEGWAISLDLELPVFGTILLHTLDGGFNWTWQMYPQENVFFRTILFLDSLKGWMGGENGVLVHTVNGGNSWTPATVDSGVFSHFPIINLSFYQQLAFACGGAFDLAGVIWLSRNAGQYWTSQGVAPEPIQKLWIVDSLNIIGVGGDYEYGISIIRSQDGGENWDYRLLPSYGIARALDFRTAREAWAPVGLSNKFIFSQDSGQSWQEYLIPDSIGVFDVIFPDSLHGYSPGTQGKVLRYNSFLVSSPQLLAPQNGATGISLSPALFWQPLLEASSYHLQVSLQPDFSTLLIDESNLDTTGFSLNGLLAGTIHYWRVKAINSTGYSRWSAVWNFTTFSSSGCYPISNKIPQKFYLSANFPNPFNAETQFYFDLPLTGEVEIIIWDVQGQIISRLLKTQLTAGGYQFKWSARDLPSGIYLLDLQVHQKTAAFIQFRQIRKLILIR